MYSILDLVQFKVEEEVQFFLTIRFDYGIKPKKICKQDLELKFAILWLKKNSDSFLPFDSIIGLNPDIFP